MKTPLQNEWLIYENFLRGFDDQAAYWGHVEREEGELKRGRRREGKKMDKDYRGVSPAALKLTRFWSLNGKVQMDLQ